MQRKAHLAELSTGAPPAQGLIQVQHGDVGEVGHAGDGLQEPEALDGAVGVDEVEAVAEGQVGTLDPPGGGHRLLPQAALVLPRPHFCVIQLQCIQPLPYLPTAR